MTERDPRTDPRPGDVLHYRSQIRTVGHPDRDWITFTWHKPGSTASGWRIVHRATLATWRMRMAGAEVLTIAPSSP